MLNSMMDAISIKKPDNCIVILTIRFLINDAKILLWKFKWI